MRVWTSVPASLKVKTAEWSEHNYTGAVRKSKCCCRALHPATRICPVNVSVIFSVPLGILFFKFLPYMDRNQLWSRKSWFPGSHFSLVHKTPPLLFLCLDNVLRDQTHLNANLQAWAWNPTWICCTHLFYFCVLISRCLSPNYFLILVLPPSPECMVASAELVGPPK